MHLACDWSTRVSDAQYVATACKHVHVIRCISAKYFAIINPCVFWHVGTLQQQVFRPARSETIQLYGGVEFEYMMTVQSSEILHQPGTCRRAGTKSSGTGCRY